MPRRNAGFSLLEVLLTIAIIGILGGLSMPVYRVMIPKNDLDVATVTVAQNLRRAQALARGVDGDSTWGVNVQSGSITVFKGTSYAARDSSYDEVFGMPTTITPSGLSETVFAKLSGDPTATGSYTLATENDSSTISINGKGTVSY